MKKALSCIVLVDMMFIFFLALSGSFSGVTSDILYYVAFLLPIGIGFLIVKSGRVEIFEIGKGMTRESLMLTAAAAAPSLLIIFSISFLTSLVLSLFTEPSAADVSGSIYSVLLLHALVPAVFEEILFRYIPITLIAPHSRRGAVLLSSMAFALAHCDLYAVPYAFAAGLIFAVLDLVSESIIPSMLLHFINNTLSVFWMRSSEDAVFSAVFISAFVGTALISGIFMVLMRKRFAERVRAVYSDKRPVGFTLEFTVMLLVLLAVTLASTFM